MTDVSESVSPVIAGDFTPYLEAIRKGRIAFTRCEPCKTWIWPPTSYCPQCRETSVRWVTLPEMTDGTVFSFIIVRHTSIPEFKDLLPYVLAILSIEGTDIRLVGRVLCDIDAVAIGDRVTPVFESELEEPVINWILAD
jgi:uncharacterized protein